MKSDFVHILRDVIERLPLDKFNKRLSSKTKLRYGTKGSFSIDLAKGTFYDHEKEQGGGVLDLIKHFGIKNPLAWLKEQGLIVENQFEPEHVFSYNDESGKLLFQVCRSADKQFRQRRPNGSGWKWGIEGVRRVIYRLPELLTDTGTVFIPEGEKHVDKLRELGLRATCNPMGAGKWVKEYAEFFRDLDVVVLPDNDEAGREHAEAIANSLLGIAKRIRVLLLPGLPPKGDVIDWLDQGHKIEQLVALAEEAPTWVKKSKLDGFIKSMSDLRTQTFVPLKYIVPRFIVEGLTLLVGKPKVRKSWFVLDASICVAQGTKFLGQRCEAGDVLYLALEDSDRRIQRRGEIMLGSASKWPSRMTFATEWPSLDEGGLELMEEWCGRVENPRLVVVDVLQRIRPRTKNKATAYETDYNSLKELQGFAAQHNLGVIVVHHTRKAPSEDVYDTVSGTQGLQAAADSVLILEPNETRRKLSGKGRDIEEYSVIIDCDDHMRWILEGDAAEVTMSDERREILDVLRSAAGGMSIRDIATAMEKDYNTVKVGLWRMRKSGEIIKENSLYKLVPEQSRFDDGVI